MTEFWQQLFSPGGLAVAFVCMLFGAILGHALARTAKYQDDKKQLIRDVAEKYRQLRERGKPGGPNGLLQSGVCRLTDSNDIEKTIAIIQDFGRSDPLAHIRRQLTGKDLCDFLNILREQRLTPFCKDDIEEAISRTACRK